MSFVHSSADLWHCFSMVSRPYYTCTVASEFYPNRASTVYRTSRIKCSHLSVPSVHCRYIPRYRLHTTKETIQLKNKSPRRTLLFSSSDSFVMTVSTERPHLSQTATTTSSTNFLTSHSCFSLIKLVFRV